MGVLERFHSKYVWDELTDCMIWVGARLPKGYGQFHAPEIGERYAHRASFALFKGRLWHLALHTCDRPSCVNPDHLFDGTAQDNSDDMRAKGRQNCAKPLLPTCRAGHDFDAGNTYWHNGHQLCRKCRAGHARAFRQRQRGGH